MVFDSAQTDIRTRLKLTIKVKIIELFWKAKPVAIQLKQSCPSFQILALMLRPAGFSLRSGLDGTAGNTINLEIVYLTYQCPFLK